eukprot:288766-Prymnesium_polylepis.1
MNSTLFKRLLDSASGPRKNRDNGQTRVEPPPSGRADTLAPHVAIQRVATSTSPGRQIAFSPAVFAGPRPPGPPSTTSATRLNPRHASQPDGTRRLPI